ncbi:hypothetical protein AERO8C_20535 [Aeromonas veronii]|uniref:Uncharacterized protein n=1 Tax=Aeromonas veronii TaxID=654 RepID=A0A653L238_AERVE|nr:hypothetical protein AERO8C_20535 [Aeromonas veronii]
MLGQQGIDSEHLGAPVIRCSQHDVTLFPQHVSGMAV